MLISDTSNRSTQGLHAPPTHHLVSTKPQLGLRNQPRQYLLSLMLPGVWERAASAQEEAQWAYNWISGTAKLTGQDPTAQLSEALMPSLATMARRGMYLLLAKSW